MIELADSLRIIRDSVVIVVTIQNLIDPSYKIFDRDVPSQTDLPIHFSALLGELLPARLSLNSEPTAL